MPFDTVLAFWHPPKELCGARQKFLSAVKRVAALSSLIATKTQVRLIANYWLSFLGKPSAGVSRTRNGVSNPILSNKAFRSDLIVVFVAYLKRGAAVP